MGKGKKKFDGIGLWSTSELPTYLSKSGQFKYCTPHTIQLGKMN